MFTVGTIQVSQGTFSLKFGINDFLLNLIQLNGPKYLSIKFKIGKKMTTKLNCLILKLQNMSTYVVSMDIQDNNLGNLLSRLGEFSTLQSICVHCDSDFPLALELRMILDDLCNINFFEWETTYTSQILEKSMYIV